MTPVSDRSVAIRLENNIFARATAAATGVSTHIPPTNVSTVAGSALARPAAPSSSAEPLSS